MSADGEVQVQVNAEGVDDAAEDLGNADGGGGVGGGGGEREQTGLRGSLKSGAIAGAIISLAGPLLEVLDPILAVLQAFLAPAAALALRLLAPFLRYMVTKILPLWLKFLNGKWNGIDTISETVGLLLIPLIATAAIILTVGQLLADLVDSAGQLLSNTDEIGADVWEYVKGGVSDIVTTIKNLPAKLVQSLKQQLNGESDQLVNPRLDSTGGPTSSGVFGPVAQDKPPKRDGAVVKINGGLDAFIEGIETAGELDIP